MTQPTFALPDQLRYDSATPSSLGDVQVAVVTPYTGSAPITVQAGNYFIVNIPKTGDSCCFDPMNSFLRFKLTISDTANTAGGIAVDFCGNTDCLFRRLKFIKEVMFLNKLINMEIYPICL